MTLPIRIGTRGSPLALVQANLVAGALRAVHGLDEAAIEIVAIRTSGDRIQDRPLAEVGGKALWTRELDRALIAGETDLSVHSMKDVESLRLDALTIAAMLPRADPRDRLIGADAIADLAHGAVVGTSSPRRAAQLLHLRPDLGILPIRGNVATRLARLAAGEVDATLLAAAGLDRLGHAEVGCAVPVDTMLPASAQGAIGIECRSGDAKTAEMCLAIDHQATSLCVSAERALLAALGGSCHSPAAALAIDEEGFVLLRAEILSEDGSERVQRSACFPSADQDAPRALAQDLLAAASPQVRALFAG